GSASWVYRYAVNGRSRYHGLGPLRLLGLKEARDRAREAAQALKLDGVDPIQARRSERRHSGTFREIAERFLTAHGAAWGSAKHRRLGAQSFDNHVHPVLGEVPITDITVDHVLRVLEPIWRAKPETGNRLRGRIERVIDYAKALGFRHGENPARWRGGIQHLLPKSNKIR